MARIVKKPEERRREIIESARRLFQTKEYDNTTMQDVIDELKIAKGTIYYYFKSKEELLEAVVETMVDEDIASKRLLLKGISGNALDKFRLLQKMNSLSEENKEILEHLHQPGNIGMHTRLLAVTITKEAPLYADIIHQGCEEGLFETNSPLEAAEFLLSGIQFLTDLGIYSWKKEDLMRRVQSFPSLIEALLKAPQDSFRFLIEDI
ncbi:MAG: TetR/AcrR family transcriptional regulator [Chloroflexi bacterium]|nr:TetR/AcrR family transcriptional regulator [Chloroflexota bacterium]